MENEGSSALKPESPHDNITQFPGNKLDNVSQFPNNQLPSEKIAAFVPNREPDVQSLDYLLWMPKGRQGFTFRTDQSLTKGPQKYDEASAELIRKKTADQMKFTQGALAKVALDQYRANPTDENKAAYEKARKNYIERSSPKVGIRNIRISGDTITGDSQPVEYQVNAALGNMESTAEQMEASTLSATSGNVIFAADKFGKKEWGFMIRNADNGKWRKVGGTLIAGFFDGKVDAKASKHSPKQGHRTLQKIDNNAITENALKELHEEIGIEAKHVKKSSITGLIVEKKNKAHHEFAVDVELKITASQAREISRQHSVENSEEFVEDWIAIDYTPETFETVLTQLESPLPISHIPICEATARRLVAETKGEKAADEYMKRLAIGATENTERINKKVRQYLRDNPDIQNHPTASQMAKIESRVTKFAADNPTSTDEDKGKFKQKLIDDRAKFNPDGFNPELLPEEQGLLEIHDALRKVGLIKQDNITQFPQSQTQQKAA